MGMHLLEIEVIYEKASCPIGTGRQTKREKGRRGGRGGSTYLCTDSRDIFAATNGCNYSCDTWNERVKRCLPGINRSSVSCSFTFLFHVKNIAPPQRFDKEKEHSVFPSLSFSHTHTRTHTHTHSLLPLSLVFVFFVMCINCQVLVRSRMRGIELANSCERRSGEVIRWCTRRVVCHAHCR